MTKNIWRWTLVAALITLGAIGAVGQDRLATMPGYDRYIARREHITSMPPRGRLSVVWSDGGRTLYYTRDGKGYRYEIASGRETEAVGPAPAERPRRRARSVRQGVARGRQFSEAVSPDGAFTALCRERNLWLRRAHGAEEIPVTADGDAKARIKYATASWVYGEELEQRTAMWWSPDSRKLAFYRFDESRVKDYYLALRVRDVQDGVEAEPYPKAGAENPVVDLLVYDLKSRKTTRIDVRDGRPFDNEVSGHYVYGVEWSPHGDELLFNRTNRRQNCMEMVAADPETGRCRVIVREPRQTAWTDNSPERRFLKDGRRFIVTSDRSGWRNYYLYDLSGALLRTLTSNEFDVERIVAVDDKAGALFYTARSGDNYLKLQLHRVLLDGTQDRRLTDPALNHTVSLSPDFRFFVDVAESHDTPPVARLIDATGSLVAVLARSDPLPSAEPLLELFTYKAADGRTNLYGTLSKPTNFDPNKRYPLLVDVYAGPESGGSDETFQHSDPMTEFGLLVARFEGRGTVGRGRSFKVAVYGKLGIVDVDDQAAGVAYLRQRRYVDGGRVGIFGTSYGGYAAAMALLRRPDLFRAASCSSSVTDWRNYDSTYTERYMGLPQENSDAYDLSSASHYVSALRGRLLLYFGTADNNVHPANTLQLIAALQSVGKSFDLQIGPDAGHGGVNRERMLEFFIDCLSPPPPVVTGP